ncbi:GAF domain-containing protein [Rhodococcus sp. X156]|uniref:GAF domain-containing protein n=1 Tax=Rhodococcus sp. X156 TaxID=2499145 RepID=UPI000FDBB345|nr:GAF domain-containing protein [Rhodococcus sp. X156]
MPTPLVFRAPMHSRREDAGPGPSVARALALGVCGTGGVLSLAPADLATAVERAAAELDERTARRLERFGAVPDGSFVWTRDAEGSYWLGRLDGPYRYDGSPEAAAVDLVHVRDCQWRETPVPEPEVPAATLQTFARGGRNFQQTHDGRVAEQTARLWSDPR